MIYSKTCQYAIRALNYLASLGKESSTLKKINAKTGVPQAYLAKIFQCLAKEGFVDSKSGPHGGYFLKVDPKRLTLLQVIKALDNISESPLSNCVMGRSECHDKNPCCLHTVWAKAREQMKQTLAKETIASSFEKKLGIYRDQKKNVVLSAGMQKVFGYKSI